MTREQLKNLRVGDRVTDPKFGTGTCVTQHSGFADYNGVCIPVRFDSEPKKRYSCHYEGLTLIPASERVPESLFEEDPNG